MRATLEARARATWAKTPDTLRAALLFFLVAHVGYFWGLHDANAKAPCLANPATTCWKYPDRANDYTLARACQAIGWAGGCLLFLTFLYENRRRRAPGHGDAPAAPDAASRAIEQRHEAP